MKTRREQRQNADTHHDIMTKKRAPRSARRHMEHKPYTSYSVEEYMDSKNHDIKKELET